MAIDPFTAAALALQAANMIGGGKKGGGSNGGQAAGDAAYIANLTAQENARIQNLNSALSRALQIPATQAVINELGFQIDPKTQAFINRRIPKGAITSAGSPGSGSGYFAPIREATEQAFTTNRENLLTNTPARGGLLNYLLAQNEMSRARQLGQNKLNLFSALTNIIPGQTQQAIQAGGAAGGVASQMAGFGTQQQLMNAQLQASTAMGQGQLLGLTLGSLLKNPMPASNVQATSSGMNFGPGGRYSVPGTSLTSFGRPI